MLQVYKDLTAEQGDYYHVMGANYRLIHSITYCEKRPLVKKGMKQNSI